MEQRILLYENYIQRYENYVSIPTRMFSTQRLEDRARNWTRQTSRFMTSLPKLVPNINSYGVSVLP